MIYIEHLLLNIFVMKKIEWLFNYEHTLILNIQYIHKYVHTYVSLFLKLSTIHV